MSSGSTTPFDGLEPHKNVSWLMWRGKHTLPQTWSRLWQRAPWMTLLSGLTSEPSMLARGVDAWISSWVGTTASPSPWPAPRWAPQTPATAGPTSLGSSRSANPPSASSRTSVLICPTGLLSSPATSKLWVSKLRAHCLRRRKSAPRTDASASSSLLPTPTASAYGSSNNGQRSDGTAFALAGKQSLMTMARTGNWPTPMASDWKQSGSEAELARKSPSLPAAVASQESRTEWATPTVKGNYARPRPSNPKEGAGLATQVGGQLNVAWVEWLLGWPIGWTGFASVATASYPRKLPKQSSSSGKLSRNTSKALLTSLTVKAEEPTP